MPILIHFLRWFIFFFGINRPRPEEERKWAIYLGVLAWGIVAAVFAFLFFVLWKIYG